MATKLTKHLMVCRIEDIKSELFRLRESKRSSAEALEARLRDLIEELRNEGDESGADGYVKYLENGGW